MIPKIIHYCWFGKGQKNELALKCIESWKRYCPDYEFVEWNEENFDINSNTYVKEAYAAKKWAFVTDYVRLFALYNYGGIYMDTDVELLENINGFLNNSAFSGFEDYDSIPTAIMGAEKNNVWIEYLLSYYTNKHFIVEGGKFDTTTNVVTITNMTKNKYNINLDNTFQKIDNVLTLYPKDYFCPKNYQTGEINLTENTVCIHHFNASWHDKYEKKIHEKNLYYRTKYKDKWEVHFKRWYKIYLPVILVGRYGVVKVVKKSIKKFLSVISKVIFKNHTIILLESLCGFDGNSGAIYNYMLSQEKYKNYIFVWFVRKKRSNVNANNRRTYVYDFKERSLVKYLLSCSAKYILYDNVPIPKISKNQKSIYLTHGCPILKNVKGIIVVPQDIDCVLCTSHYMKETISYQFSADIDKLFFCGLPRNDDLFKKSDELSKLAISFNQEKVILWMPTFRKSAYSDRNDSNKVSKMGIPLISCEEDLKKLNDYLEARRVKLILKTHPGQDLGVVKVKTHSNILFITQEEIIEKNINLYTMMSQTDALLTDYSSVAFDYMLLDKPIGYIVDDIEEYKLGFAFENIFDMMPGNKVKDINDLYRFIDDITNDLDIYRADRHRVSTMANDYQDGNNCKRLVEFLGL